MLIRLYPEQVSEQWDVIKPAIEASLPVNAIRTEEGMNNILDHILANRMQCWLIAEKQRDEDVYALLLTYTLLDPIGASSVFIYALYGYRPVPMEMWISSFKQLQGWARKNNCVNIIAFTDNQKVVNLVRNLGGNANQVLVSLEVNGNGKDIRIHQD